MAPGPAWRVRHLLAAGSAELFAGLPERAGTVAAEIPPRHLEMPAGPPFRAHGGVPRACRHLHGQRRESPRHPCCRRPAHGADWMAARIRWITVRLTAHRHLFRDEGGHGPRPETARASPFQGDGGRLSCLTPRCRVTMGVLHRAITVVCVTSAWIIPTAGRFSAVAATQKGVRPATNELLNNGRGGERRVLIRRQDAWALIGTSWKN